MGPVGSATTAVGSDTAPREERAKLYGWVKSSRAWQVRGKGRVDFVTSDETGEVRRSLRDIVLAEADTLLAITVRARGGGST